MLLTLRNEWPTIIITLLPLIYLIIIWNKLPDIVPIHWNASGEIDDYGPKSNLILVVFLLPILTYLIFTFAPKLDPKKKLLAMGQKWHKLKFLMIFFMSLLTLCIIYSTLKNELPTQVLTMLIGGLYVVIGNFFPTLKPNYFIGIRIPWTLSDANNWKKTHQFAGKFWLVGGLSIIAYGLFARPEALNIFFLVITSVIVIIPIIYSFKIKTNTH